MPDFSVQVSIGAGVAAWSDTHLPPRTNPLPGKPHLYLRVPLSTPIVRVSCTVGGVFEPMDAALGGRLFLWWWAETPFPPVPIATLAGQSSVVQFGAILGAQPGHHLLVAWRPSGGSVGIPIIVE